MWLMSALLGSLLAPRTSSLATLLRIGSDNCLGLGRLLNKIP